MVDLKEVLMVLGNRLVLEYGYEPATATELLPHNVKNTHVINAFTIWMNEHLEAQEALKELGMKWSMPKKKGI